MRLVTSSGEVYSRDRIPSDLSICIQHFEAELKCSVGLYVSVNIGRDILSKREQG